MPSDILAVHSGALGDLVLFGQLLRRMGGRVTLVAGGEKGRLLAGMGVVNRAMDFDALPMHELFADTPADQCRLPALLGRHGRLISCFGAGDETAERRLAMMCAARRVDFPPIRPPEGYDGHLLDLWAQMLGSAAPGSQSPPVAWKVPRPWREAAADALSELHIDPAKPYWAIHPGAGAQAKCWPLERFIELARAGIASRLDAEPLFVLGPVECDRWGGRVEQLRRQLAALVCPPLSTLAGVLAGAAGYVGNDSGVSHLSAAVGTPTAALFLSSRVRHFAPVGRHVLTLSASRLADITAPQVQQTIEQLPTRQAPCAGTRIDAHDMHHHQ
ncbi:MAG TPA: glycosyltransferase family 9 protein [Phycisphaerae bacterium]|nr:glycosyltransferase family 9 protein [Phycisphaerae bacterium]